jgi:hypothetical protein
MLPSTVPSRPDETASRLRRAFRFCVAGDRVLAASMIALVVYYVSTKGVFQGKASGDGWFGFQYLRAIFFEHSLDMQKVLPQWKPYFGVDTVTHHMPNRCPFGPVFLWAPFYLIACAIATVGKWLHLANATPDSPFHAWFAGLGSLTAALVGMRQVYRLVERHLDRNAARLAAIVSVWATPVAWYAVTQPLYQHAAAFGIVALLVERWDATRGETRWQRFALLGALGAFAMWMRPQEAIFLLLPGVEALVHVVRGPDRKRWLVGGVVLCAAAAIVFFPQTLVWRFYTGKLSPPQWEPIRWKEPLFIHVLFSTRSGLFPWSPIAYAAAFGLALAKRARLLAFALLTLFAIDVYVCAGAWVPSAAYSYGARRLSDGAPLLALGAALLYDRARRKRIVVGFAALCVALCVFTMEMQRIGHVPSSGGFARTGGMYLDEARLPGARVLDAIGYPFVQPIGWIYALYWHTKPSAFEGVVGNFLLDTDGQWFTILPDSKSLPLNRDRRANIDGGLEYGTDTKLPARVTGPVRLLVYMFEKQPLTLKVVGKVGDGPLVAKWNGVPVPVEERDPNGYLIGVPKRLVRRETNEIALDVPVGSLLQRIDFTPRARDP